MADMETMELVRPGPISMRCGPQEPAGASVPGGPAHVGLGQQHVHLTAVMGLVIEQGEQDVPRPGLFQASPMIRR